MSEQMPSGYDNWRCGGSNPANMANDEDEALGQNLETILRLREEQHEQISDIINMINERERQQIMGHHSSELATVKAIHRRMGDLLATTADIVGLLDRDG